MKTISLPGSNLYMSGFGRDINGNKTVKLAFPNTRGFSIQTSGNLPGTHRISGAKLDKLSQAQIATIAKEAVAYIQQYGTALQQKKLRIYKR